MIKISMPSSHLSSSQLPHLHYFSLTHLLASFSPVSFSSPPSHFSFLFFSSFFSYHGWAETPPSRCCWFSQGHCWPWGTQKHSDQCSDMITPEVCLSSDGPRWCRQALWTPQNKALWSVLLSDLQLSQNNAPGATCVAVWGDTLKTVSLHESRNVAFFLSDLWNCTYAWPSFIQVHHHKWSRVHKPRSVLIHGRL